MLLYRCTHVATIPDSYGAKRATFEALDPVGLPDEEGLPMTIEYFPWPTPTFAVGDVIELRTVPPVVPAPKD